MQQNVLLTRVVCRAHYCSHAHICFTSIRFRCAKLRLPFSAFPETSRVLERGDSFGWLWNGAGMALEWKFPASTVTVPGATHQRHEQRRWPGLPQERMGEQFRGRRTLHRIPHQHPVEEVLQPAGHFVGVFQLWRWHVADAAHRLQRRLVEERWLTVYHLDHHDAERPDVYLGPVRQSGDYFRRHPVRCADE